MNARNTVAGWLPANYTIKLHALQVPGQRVAYSSTHLRCVAYDSPKSRLLIIFFSFL